MARARNIKPGFFKNYELADQGPYAQILFAGLWCLADREGRLEDKPRLIKAELFPYYECDVNGELTKLERLKLISRYVVGGVSIIQVSNFKKHQTPHNTEKASILPAFNGEEQSPVTVSEQSTDLTVDSRKSNGGNPPDSLIPDSLNTDTGNKPPQAASRLQTSFDQFWKAYPKKSAKGDAEKAFKKIAPNAELLQAILDAIEAQKHGKAWLDEDGKYIPNPATWLNAKRWDDEVVPYAGPSVKQSTAPWWSSDALILAKGAEMGMKPHNGEYMPSFKGRVQAAIDNGGVPPAAPRSNITTFDAEVPRGTVRPDTAALKQMLRSKVVA